MIQEIENASKSISADVERGGPDASGQPSKSSRCPKGRRVLLKIKEKLFFDMKDGGQNTIWAKSEKYNMVILLGLLVEDSFDIFRRWVA